MSTRGTRRIGMAGYARILRLLLDKPDTTDGIIQRTGFGHTAIRRILPSLHTLRVIYIAGWEFADRAPARPVFAVGSQPDAPAPDTRPNGRPVKAVRIAKVKRHPVELLAFVSILRALSDEHSKTELMHASGLSWHGTTAALKALRSLRLVRVRSWAWREQGGPAIPSYEWAPDGRDADRPKPIGRVAVNRRYREARAAREAQSAICKALAGTREPQRTEQLEEA